jgi:L-lactate dehydrogenase complex protein LldE
MKVGLFIPCYIDQFYPQVGIATLQILEKNGCEVVFPLNQTCCGQPMANSGFNHLSNGCNENFTENFVGVDYIVCPSGSCTLHIKDHLTSAKNPEQAVIIRKQVYELTEFLVDVLHLTKISSRFPYRVGFHSSCHGQRGLHLSSMSEQMLPHFSKPELLLNTIEGITVLKPERVDECCGFGGTFSIFEEAVSSKMGKDRIHQHAQNSVDYITGVDMSCLMHMEGILKRQNSSIKVIHIAEILNAG